MTEPSVETAAGRAELRRFVYSMPSTYDARGHMCRALDALDARDALLSKQAGLLAEMLPPCLSAISDARANERDRCAGRLDSWGREASETHDHEAAVALHNAAEQIRALRDPGA